MAVKKINTWMIVAIILGVLLVGSIVYIYASKYRQFRDVKEKEIFTQGIQFGYLTAVQQLVNASAGCNPVSVSAENKTTQFIDYSCLK